MPNITLASMLVEKDASVWERVFDKYGSLMYGIISEMTGNQMMTEELFEEAFFQLKEKGISGDDSTSIRLCIYRHTHAFTTEQLKKRGLKPRSVSSPVYDNCQLLKLLWTEPLTLKEAGERLNLSENQARKKLNEEFNYLRLRDHTEEKEESFKLSF